MKRSTLPLALFLLLPVLPGQDPNAKKDPDPEVAEKLGDLDDIVTNRKMERDAEAGAVLTALILKWRGGLCEKDQKQIVKGIGNVFLKGKVRPAEQAQIYIAAATALGETDESGADPLEKAFESKRFPDKPEWVQLRESLLRAMGKTKNEKKVKFLIDTARRGPRQLQRQRPEDPQGDRRQAVDPLRLDGQPRPCHRSGGHRGAEHAGPSGRNPPQVERHIEPADGRELRQVRREDPPDCFVSTAMTRSPVTTACCQAAGDRHG